MKKPREYKADEFGEYCDDRITKDDSNVFDVVKELWNEIQELKQDLSSYQEYVGSDAEWQNNKAYEKGRQDECEEWECAVADKIIKHDEDIYKALPEVIEKVRADAISSVCNCNNFPRLYKIYHGIKQRCKNSKSANYKHYGGRGIFICEEWDNDFSTFCLWAICNGYNDKLTIDRIDVNGNYEPNNCKWSTKREQANNRNSNTMYEYNGEIHSLSDWALLMGIEHNTIYSRWQKGWRGEELFQPPKKPNNRKDNRMITFNGKTQCMADWSRELGIKQATLSSRINDRGWSVEKAFTTPVAEQLKESRNEEDK